MVDKLTPEPSSTPAAGHDPRVRIGRAGLLLRGESEERPLLCGAMHYFQLKPEVWPRCLDAMVDLGLSAVDTYVPWVVHEREPGSHVFDQDHFAKDSFDGTGYFACRNLAAFLAACHERQLLVLLRPGPQINAELTAFGYPERILKDDDYLARGAGGNPVIMPTPPRFFPVPSYASERFLADADVWLGAVARFLSQGGFCWPDGPVVALQVDNELCYFFRDGAYDQDYHPDAIILYRQFLQQRYGDDLPEGYDVAASSAQPPRRMDAQTPHDLVRHLDWMAFKEHLQQRALQRMATTLRDGGVDLPLTHNLPSAAMRSSSPLSAFGQTIDLVGMDQYSIGRDYHGTREATQLLAGSSSGFPLLGELGWGGWPWWFPQDIHDQLANALTALMHGVKGLSFYMAVERDRWYGAPISAEGERDPERFELTAQLVKVLRESGLLQRLDQQVQIALLSVRDYQRLSLCTSLLDPLPPLALSLLGLEPTDWADRDSYGLPDPVQREHGLFNKAVKESFEQLSLPFHIVDSDASLEILQRYRLIVGPCFDFLDEALLDRLGAYVGGGGTLALGPRGPTLGRTMKPLEKAPPSFRLLPKGLVPETLSEILGELQISSKLSCDRDDVELAYYQGDDQGEDRQSVLFVANHSDSSCRANIRGLQPKLWVWDALSGDPVDPSCLQLEANQVCMLRLRPAEAKA